MGYGAVVSSGGEVVKQFLVVEEGDCGDLRGYAGQGPVVATATAAQAVPGAVNGEGGDQDYGGAGYRGRAARGLPGLHEPQGSGGTAPPGGNGGVGVGVVVGCDARHRSAEFAEEVARVLAGAGLAVQVLPLPCPTPLLAFAVRHLGTAAGIMVTASHNPAADNGYKLYLSDGAQVIPPADREIEARIGALGALSSIPLAPAGSPLITRHGGEVAAWSPSQPKVNPAWINCFQRSKLFCHHQRCVVGQHDSAAPDADRAGGSG